jgi:hypothetical protein
MVDKYLSMRPSATQNLERVHAVFGNITASIDMISWDILRSERIAVNLKEYGLVTNRAAAEKRTQTH